MVHCSNNDLKSLRSGNILCFGNYDWRVLDIHNGKALLLSEKIIEKKKYHQQSMNITWAECDLRDYLNGANKYRSVGFYDNLISSTPQLAIRIAETEVTTRENSWYGTNGGAVTNDRIFLLSIDEMVQYFGGRGQLKNRLDNSWAIVDEYDSERVAYDTNDMAYWWWLRSPGHINEFAARVSGRGRINLRGFSVVSESAGYGASPEIAGGGGLHPAMWLIF